MLKKELEKQLDAANELIRSYRRDNDDLKKKITELEDDIDFAVKFNKGVKARLDQLSSMINGHFYAYGCRKDESDMTEKYGDCPLPSKPKDDAESRFLHIVLHDLGNVWVRYSGTSVTKSLYSDRKTNQDKRRERITGHLD